MTTPSSLEELREKIDSILDTVYEDGFNQPVLVNMLASLLRSHMEAVSYLWTSIQRHEVIQQEVVNLDKDPSGKTIDIEECYVLPKKWVDERAKSYLEGEKYNE